MRFIAPGLIGAGFAIASPAQADTLEDALVAAYETNPTLQAARADLRATDENVPIQRSSGLPSVNGSSQYTEFLKQSSASFTAPDRSVSGNVDLSVPLYSGGAVKNSIRAAKTRVVAGRADLRATESSVFNQVVAAYMDVVLNEALVSLSRNNVDVLTVNLQATSDRFEIGDLTRTDVAQSESRLAIARGNLESAEANLINARETYIQLVGKAPVDLQPPPPLPNLPEDVQTAVAVALENNPDIAGAQERAKAAGYDIDVAGAGRAPKISAFAGGNYTNYLDTLGGVVGAGSIAQAQTSAQAGIQLSIPIFQGGLPAAQQRQAQARASQALEQTIATERQVIAQTRASYASWRAANQIIQSNLSAVSTAELSLEGVKAENSVGNRTILDILNAQQELLSAQIDLVTARRNAYVAGFSLLAAMGQVEARDLGLGEDTTLYDPVANYKRVRHRIWDWDRDPDPAAQSTRTVDIPAQGGDIPGD
ncbi:TolC family outer membrane protein [Altererythrobacter indicus]|uniref:TolC family outer membrane protein n=1 Tax=Altericroceibacterium indicum TaxID=374177 RepID=A0A845ABT4_9SPHN|nr:TolC family outer membrane protein [Altericroceibacterium indicum]MXP26451.1 TolC family outer membrane protein [Altericroceibacterium indicum]